MEGKIEQNNRRYLYRILCVLTVASTLLPVTRGSIMGGGIVAEWAARVTELAMAPLQLFPTAETLAKTGILVNAMNSNVWFFFMGFLYRLTGNLVLAYRIYMLAIQVGTFLFSKLFFERFFGDKKTKFPAFFGILLYMTNPYRIYVCYDYANLSIATAWMVLPLYAWAVLGLIRKDGSVWRNLIIGAIALAGVGYADAIIFLIMLGVTLLAILYFRTLLPAVAAAAGGVLFLPGLYRLIQYLFTDAYQELNLSVQSIMSKGYRIGQFFSTYAFRDGHPGMGMGMMICLLAGLWLCFVGVKGKSLRREGFFAGVAIIFLFLSTRYFPWDVAQRLGSWALKLVGLINAPTVFGGIAWGCLCIPAAASVESLSDYENKIVAFAVPLFVLFICLGVCVLQCNILIDSRVPLALP